MSSLARPPDPCLVAIILIVRSRAGPRLVFHYPPNPLSENALRSSLKGRGLSRTKGGQKTKPSDSDISDQTATSDEDEDDAQLSGSGVLAPGSSRRASNFGIDDHSASQSPALGSIGPGNSRKRRGENSDEVENDTGSRGDGRRGDESHQTGQSILGLQADVWEKLLSPPRVWHKRRFEVGINDLAFVGWPVFVREDGTWRKEKRKKQKNKRSRPAWEGAELGHNEEAEEVVDNAAEGDADANAADSSQTTSSDGGVGQQDSDDKDSMTMFNVTFVLDPPLLEYSTRLREIYDTIIKKFAKALKWEQARTDYVWKESQHILHVKEMAREKGMLCFPFYG